MERSVTPVEVFCDRHNLKKSHLAALSGRAWPTAKSWFVGTTSPTLDDAIRVVEGLRAKGVKASLNDFDPAVAA